MCEKSERQSERERKRGGGGEERKTEAVGVWRKVTLTALFKKKRSEDLGY